MGRVDELIHSSVENKLMHGVVGKTNELIHYRGIQRVDKLTRRRRGRVNELIHSGVGNELMHGVVGRADKLIHCGGMGRVDKLASYHLHTCFQRSTGAATLKGRRKQGR